jgi:hypothetical protein
MYSELIKDYDKKLKLIIIENNDLKSYMVKMLSDIDLVLSQSSKSELGDSETKYQDLIQLPFDEIFKTLHQEFESKVKMLDHMLKSQSDTLSPRNDVTKSSINSLSEALNKTLLHNADRSRDKASIMIANDFNHQKDLFKNSSISSSSLSSITSIDSRKGK